MKADPPTTRRCITIVWCGSLLHVIILIIITRKPEVIFFIAVAVQSVVKLIVIIVRVTQPKLVSRRVPRHLK